MSKEILLTMGMGVYNEEKHVAEAIESLLAQTYKDFILLIVDNASTDRTPQICKYYAEKDRRIVYVKNERNMGGAFSFLYLLENTNTPYFMLCSGNDKWHPYFVEKLLPALEEEDIILSYPDAAAIDPDGTLFEPFEDDDTTTGIDKPADRYLYILRRFRVRLFNILYGIWKTQALKNCSSDLHIPGPDNIIFYKAAFEGKFKMRKEVLFWVRRHITTETRRERIIKQCASLTGEKITGKESAFLIMASFIRAIAAVPFCKRYQLKTTTRIWLSANAFVVSVWLYCILPMPDYICRKLLPAKFYLKLKSFYKKTMRYKY